MSESSVIPSLAQALGVEHELIGDDEPLWFSIPDRLLEVPSPVQSTIYSRSSSPSHLSEPGIPPLIPSSLSRASRAPTPSHFSEVPSPVQSTDGSRHSSPSHFSEVPTPVQSTDGSRHSSPSHLSEVPSPVQSTDGSRHSSPSHSSRVPSPAQNLEGSKPLVTLLDAPSPHGSSNDPPQLQTPRAKKSLSEWLIDRPPTERHRTLSQKEWEEGVKMMGSGVPQIQHSSADPSANMVWFGTPFRWQEFKSES